ncbi:hypothetical protein HK097_010874 [Rhizophlyctis rosea]|uniref:BTB domain-containing protein n=1 Tax=Rhizophlyctis rosea TaxID=64517 RepID=A0AAD5X077_9FUNG|nr:hypothetical protein HK097_010874 [Rhizophlyctis rosea]
MTTLTETPAKQVFKLAQSWLDLLKTVGDEADVELVTGCSETVLLAHKLVLKTRCDFFKTKFSPPWDNSSASERAIVKLPNISTDTVEVVLEYIYGGLLQKETIFYKQLNLYEAYKFLLLDDAGAFMLDLIRTSLSHANEEIRIRHLRIIRYRSDPDLTNLTISCLAREITNAFRLFVEPKRKWKICQIVKIIDTCDLLVKVMECAWSGCGKGADVSHFSHLANAMNMLGHWINMHDSIPPEDYQTILEVIMDLFANVDV